MNQVKLLAMVVVLAGSLALTACMKGGATSTQDIDSCFNDVPIAHVHAVGNAVSFRVTTARGTSTYSVAKSAFDGAPAALRDGDVVSFCVDHLNVGGNVTTTITELSDQGHPAATATP